MPAAEEEPIFLRRNRDGSLDFPPDVRPAPASAAQGSTPEESRHAQSGALVWAFAFEELGPSAPSSSALSLPGPGGVWRTAVVRRERRDRFTYQRCLVAPDGRQWRGSQLRQLAEHLFASRPEQLRQALYMLNLPPARETGEESEGGAASGVPSPAVAGALPQELGDAAAPPPPPPPPPAALAPGRRLGGAAKAARRGEEEEEDEFEIKSQLPERKRLRPAAPKRPRPPAAPADEPAARMEEEAGAAVAVAEAEAAPPLPMAGGVAAVAEILPAAAVALPLAANPVLDLWSVLPGTRRVLTGQVVGKS